MLPVFPWDYEPLCVTAGLLMICPIASTEADALFALACVVTIPAAHCYSDIVSISER